MKLCLDEVRRLTGSNLLWEKPGAIVDVFVDEGDQQQVAECWQKWAGELLNEFGWESESTVVRTHDEGLNMAMSAPIDALYTACELAELAWDCCVAELQQEPMPRIDSRLDELRSELADELNPELLTLMAAAEENGVVLLADDDEVSVGMGIHAQVWPVNQLPTAAALEWPRFQSISTAYVTGTNGKSTSVRLADQIAKAAGITSGVTSTDFIRVGDDIIDHGDYSGPGGARMLLRDARTEMAFMEVARGGILRRGLPVPQVDAALVTNVASDHLGQYGINTVEELAEVKLVVAKALNSRSVLVVNADNDLAANEAQKCHTTFCWFSTNPQHPLICQQLEFGGRAVTIIDDAFAIIENSKITKVCHINDAPMTMNGSAEHNIQNALGVIGLCSALNLPMQAIVAGLESFGSTVEDNPGRGNIYHLPNCDVIVDFAHNEHSMRAVVNMVKHMPAGRRVVMFGHAGDRTDKDIHDLSNAVADLEANHYFITELETHLRGRELGELPNLMTTTLQSRGVPEEQITVASDPLSGAQQAVAQAKEGDVLLLFVLDMRAQVQEWLTERVNS